MKSRYEIKVKLRLKEIENWYENGLTDIQVAKNLGIGRGTLYKYKNEHNELADIIDNTKINVDLQVENALFKKALGFEYEEITSELQINENTKKESMLITKKVKKTISPDTTACIFWLKNREPARWKDKKEINHSGNLTGLTDAELDAEIIKLSEEYD